MVKRLRKRGAVELSVTTIVVVVIGITILTLGLKWVYDIFGGIGEQSQQLRRISETQILEIFGESEEAIYTPQTLYDAEQGDNVNIDIFFRNVFADVRTFQYRMNLLGGPAGVQESMVLSRMTWTSAPRQLSSGDAYKDIVIFDTKALPLGTYKFEATLECVDVECVPEPVQFIVDVR